MSNGDKAIFNKNDFFSWQSQLSKKERIRTHIRSKLIINFGCCSDQQGEEIRFSCVIVVDVICKCTIDVGSGAFLFHINADQCELF